MGCTKIGHRHVWPTAGLLIIQRCETRCNFCSGASAKKSWKYAWFLRRHVRAIHIGKNGKGQYPDLEVDESWDDSKLHHMQLKVRMAQQSGIVQFIEQPEFEEQSLGGFHPGSLGHIKQEVRGDVDIFNNGPPEFLQDPNGTYPSLADEYAYANIQNPFLYSEIEAFIFEATVGQTEFDATDDEQSEGFVEAEEVNKDDALNEDGTVMEGVAKTEDIAVDEAGAVNQEDVVNEQGIVNSDGIVQQPFEPADPAGPATVTPSQLQSNPTLLDMPMSDWTAAPKYFMADAEYDSAEEDSLEDLPLAQGLDRYQTKPSFGDYGRILSMLDAGAQKMADEGMQLSDMLPVIAMFAHSLASRKDEARVLEPDMA